MLQKQGNAISLVGMHERVWLMCDIAATCHNYNKTIQISGGGNYWQFDCVVLHYIPPPPHNYNYRKAM